MHGTILRSEQGFTLFEVLIALGIITIVITSALLIESNSMRSTERARDLTTVAMLAGNLMRETELKMEGKPFTELKESETGKFESPFENYSWLREVKEVEFPSLGGGGDSEGEEDGGSSGQNSQEQMFTKLVGQFLSKSLREVKVTVSWDAGQGVQSFQVGTYWVDFSQEFQLSQ